MVNNITDDMVADAPLFKEVLPEFLDFAGDEIVFPDWKHRRLSDLAEYYGISTVGAHRALADCRMNQRVFEIINK